MACVPGWKNRIISFLAIAMSTFPAAAQTRRSVYTPLEQGQFEGAKRVGIWDYYDRPATKSLSIYYDNLRMVYIQPDTNDFTIRSNDQWIKAKLTVPCRFHGSKAYLLNHYYKNFQFPEELVRLGKSMRTWLTFEVWPDGIARNPAIHKDPGYGVKEQLLAIFEAAPPWWIVGVQKNDSTAICRFAISFTLCFAACSPPDNIEEQGTVLMDFKTTTRFERPRFTNIWQSENKGIEFSPDRRKILVNADVLVLDSIVAGASPVVIDRSTKEVKRINYGLSNGAWWINNDEILLRYIHEPLPFLLAKYDLATGTTRATSDSVTFAHNFSPDKSKLVFLTRSNNNKSLTIWIQEFSTGRTRQLLPPFFESTIPIGWSPDSKYLILERRNGDGQESKHLLNLESLKEIPLPILTGELAGWSSDGETLYLAQYKWGDYLLQGQLYKFSLSQQTLSEITERKKGLHYALYNAAIDKFFVLIKGEAFILDNQPGAEPTALFGDCIFPVWHPDGEGIVYINRTDWQVWYWSRADSTHTQLTFGKNPFEKKKKKK